MLGGLEKRVGEAFPPIGFEQGSWQPGGLIGVPDRARFVEVAAPENIVRRRARAIVGDHDAGNAPQHRGVPEMLGRQRADPRPRDDGEILRRRRAPIEERAPDRFRLLLIEALEDHRDLDEAATDVDLFAPVWVEKRLTVEFEELADEAAVGVVGLRLEGRGSAAEIIGKLVRAYSDAGDDSEPAAAALERPE